MSLAAGFFLFKKSFFWWILSHSLCFSQMMGTGFKTLIFDRNKAYG